MTAEQHAVYLSTYSGVLGLTLARAPDMEAAVKEASRLAELAVNLYPAGDAPAKRGPGRPPKEVQA